MHRMFALLSLLFPLILGSSDYMQTVTPVRPRVVLIKASPVDAPSIQHAKMLKFLKAWSLTSNDSEFGGLSALTNDESGFIALSDQGIVARFAFADDGQIEGASLSPLPKGCALDHYKTDRDSESITRDPISGKLWIGFEWRNAICRSGADLANAEQLMRPVQMHDWPRTGGAESMVRLHNGQFIVIAERPMDDGPISPMLVYAGDPTNSGAHATKMRYRPPPGYRPTDIAELPDGRLIILNRSYAFPITFSAILTLVDDFKPSEGAIVEGKPIVKLSPPGLHDNFEGVTVTQAQGHIFIWLVSDDNYLSVQKTYLLAFELLSPSPAAARP